MKITNMFRRMPKIEVEMIPAKMSFFLTDGYFGAIMPFMNVFYVNVGLSATQAGLISGISLLVSSIFNPLWSNLADATGYRKLIFVIMCLGSACTVFPMPWVEKAIAIPKKNISSVHNHSTNAWSYEYVKPVLSNSNVLFYALLALNVVAWIFFTNIRCYVDGLVTNVVNTATKKRSYGSQRVFSSIGYASITFLTGVIADHYHPEDMSSYTAAFFVFLPCTLLLIPWGCKLIGQAKWEEVEEKQEESTDNGGFSKILFSKFKDIDFMIFFLSVVVSGLTLNIFNCFFFLLMEHEMHSTKTLMTFSIVVSVVCEVTVFAFSKKIIKFCRGTFPAFIIGIFSFFPRFMFMSYVTNPWLVLLVQPLHGLGMGLSWAAAIDHTYISFPPEVRVTAVALMSSIEFMASNAVGNLLGGLLYDLYGGRVLFRGSGIIAGVWCLFVALYYGIKRKLRPSEQTVEPQHRDATNQGVELPASAGEENKGYEI